MIQKQIPTLPSLPGVYIFKNTLQEIIYVGKAKSLKKRIGSYFAKYGRDWKIDALLDEHISIEHIVTHSEQDALLLEAQLIKEHQPKYNVLLKTGRPFVYILFTQDRLPQIEIVRNKKRKGSYFGPFLHKKHARKVYDYLLKTFQLTWCSKKISGGCLRYHLGLCTGNCKDSFDEDAYLFRVQLATNLLKNKYKQSLKKLEKKIQEYSDNFEFEKAKHLNDYYQNLETIFIALKAKFTEKKYAKEVFLATIPVWQKTQEDTSLAQKIQSTFALPVAPETIDCFDISHFQSTHIVGSCIRFKHGIPDKNNFRRFKIRTLTKQNDYAALQEVVTRRYKNKEDVPDLIIIDGGKGQLHAVQDILPYALIVSLAKREERLFTPNNPEGVKLNPNSDVGNLFIGLRDYAHHFAISYHRNRRNKNF